MKKYIYIFIGLIVAIAYYKYNNPTVNFKEDTKSGIQFHKGTWQQALDLAKQQNKLIFLDVYATWCGPCKKLKRDTFSDSTAAVIFNNNFINVSVDAENGEGVDISSKYNVTSYPSLYLINSNGKIVNKTGGYMSPTELITFGKTVNK
ncbi:MAG: thioredoxin family protein [Ferruginibacter sp.]|nr:thioredoxin family protein [Ferruginibacter sp.]